MSEHEDEMPHDPLPEIVAGIDQMLAMAPELARAARGYFDAFRAEGFSDAQAIYLTAAQLHSDPGSPS